jgi:hypothetical protein
MKTEIFRSSAKKNKKPAGIYKFKRAFLRFHFAAETLITDIENNAFSSGEFAVFYN